MGIFFDHGITYLISTEKLKDNNYANVEIFRITGKCKTLCIENKRYIIVIDTKETDARLINLPIYDEKEWFKNNKPFAILLDNIPEKLVLTEAEKTMINEIENYLGVTGNWYEINKMCTTL